MVNNVVNATYTETYDLNTAIGELSVLGVHTPQAPTVLKNFKGFFMQYKKYRILGCDIRMVCASRQEIDPIDVGLEAGKVDPRDVLNPILFKACTNDAMNTLLDRIYRYDPTGNGDVGSDVNASLLQTRSSAQNDLDAYYQLLADDGFRQFHPQSGLEINHLVPMVHKIVTTQPLRVGFEGKGSPTLQGSNQDSWAPANIPLDLATTGVQFLSNGITPLPWFDTAQEYTQKFTGDSNYTSSTKVINLIPRTFLGCIVLPPAILQSLYFRMKIKWYIQFADFRPAWEIGPIKEVPGGDVSPSNGGILGASTGYFNIYHTASKKELPNEQSSFSTTESTEVELVNEVPR